MLEGFKKFIARGNMIDMAVGVVMGGAVTSVVNAIVNKVINPLIAMIFGKGDMNSLLSFSRGNNVVSFGAVLGALINFLIIAAAVYFCIIVPINKLRDIAALAAKKAGHGPAEPEEVQVSPEEQTVALLQEIRDELAKNQNAANGASPNTSTLA